MKITMNPNGLAFSQLIDHSLNVIYFSGFSSPVSSSGIASVRDKP